MSSFPWAQLSAIESCAEPFQVWAYENLCNSSNYQHRDNTRRKMSWKPLLETLVQKYIIMLVSRKIIFSAKFYLICSLGQQSCCKTQHTKKVYSKSLRWVIKNMSECTDPNRRSGKTRVTFYERTRNWETWVNLWFGTQFYLKLVQLLSENKTIG